MRKGINWELCNKLKFDYADKWYTYKQVSALENETHKILFAQLAGAVEYTDCFSVEG